MKNQPPREERPGGIGSLAIASTLCLVFAIYLGWPAVEHMLTVNYMVEVGVETQGVTRVCTKTRGHAKVVLVDFTDAAGKEWTCGGQMKADCDEPKAKRFVVYDPASPVRCMIGPMVMFKGLATGVIGPVAASFGFFASFVLFGFHAIRRRRQAKTV
jgi:hypothetical protein